jgi:hypothetical protein
MWTGGTDIDHLAVLTSNVDALLKEKRVFKSKAIRLQKQTVAWQNESDRDTELLRIYVSSAGVSKLFDMKVTYDFV